MTENQNNHTRGESRNRGEDQFLQITNKDVWVKLVDLDSKISDENRKFEQKIDKLSVKLYAFATAVVIIGTFLSITGGISLG